MAQFSLSWDAYKQNICTGLSALQQNGEFVDMTIAADGHHVKVHQMVMSLVSPYIKDLITSAQCPHPVIFLNKVSYATLCSLLEYIYTGEVMVDKDNMAELAQAGKELHIRGLEDMKIDNTSQNLSPAANRTNEGQPLAKRRYFTKEAQQNIDDDNVRITIGRSQPSFKRESCNVSDIDDQNMNDSTFADEMDMDHDHDTDRTMTDTKTKRNKTMETTLQYTKSNRGALQIIVNRYIYNLIYTSKRDSGTRRWQCVDYRDKQCKAVVFTKDGVIVQRYAAHSHPFHDKRILKKVKENLVFSTLNDTDINDPTKSQSKTQKQENESLTTSNNKNTDREDTTDAE